MKQSRFMMAAVLIVTPCARTLANDVTWVDFTNLVPPPPLAPASNPIQGSFMLGGGAFDTDSAASDSVLVAAVPPLPVVTSDDPMIPAGGLVQGAVIALVGGATNLLDLTISVTSLPQQTRGRLILAIGGMKDRDRVAITLSPQTPSTDQRFVFDGSFALDGSSAFLTPGFTEGPLPDISIDPLNPTSVELSKLGASASSAVVVFGIENIRVNDEIQIQFSRLFGDGIPDFKMFSVGFVSFIPSPSSSLPIFTFLGLATTRRRKR